MDAKRFFVLKKKNSAKEKILLKNSHVLSKSAPAALKKNYVTELPRKNKSTAHILANIIPFVLSLS